MGFDWWLKQKLSVLWGKGRREMMGTRAQTYRAVIYDWRVSGRTHTELESSPWAVGGPSRWGHVTECGVERQWATGKGFWMWNKQSLIQIPLCKESGCFCVASAAAFLDPQHANLALFMSSISREVNKLPETLPQTKDHCTLGTAVFLLRKQDCLLTWTSNYGEQSLIFFYHHSSTQKCPTNINLNFIRLECLILNIVVCRAHKIAQRTKVLATKPRNLSSIPRVHMMAGRN